MALIARNELISVCAVNQERFTARTEKDTIHIFGHGSDIGFNVLFNYRQIKTMFFAFRVKGTVKHLKEWGRARFEAYRSISDPEPSYIDEETFSSVPIDEGEFRLVVFKLPEDLPPQGKVQLIFIGPAIVDISVRDMMVN